MCLVLHDGTLSPWAMQTRPLERSIGRSIPFWCRASSSLHPPICCHVEAPASEGSVGCFAGRRRGVGSGWEWAGACKNTWQRNQPRGGKPPTNAHLTRVTSRTRQHQTAQPKSHFLQSCVGFLFSFWLSKCRGGMGWVHVGRLGRPTFCPIKMFGTVFWPVRETRARPTSPPPTSSSISYMLCRARAASLGGGRVLAPPREAHDYHYSRFCHVPQTRCLSPWHPPVKCVAAQG
jgi:hypothetical protein